MKRYLLPCHFPQMAIGQLNSVGQIAGRKRGLSTSAMNCSQAAVMADFSPAGGLFPARPPT
jgi:hypothetical protein